MRATQWIASIKIIRPALHLSGCHISSAVLEYPLRSECVGKAEVEINEEVKGLETLSISVRLLCRGD